MKIRTRLDLSLLASVLAGGAIGTALLWEVSEIRRNLGTWSRVEQLTQQVFHMRELVHAFPFPHQRARAVSQWGRSHRRTGRTIDGLRNAGSGQHASVATIAILHRKLGRLADRLTANLAIGASGRPRPDVRRRLQSRLNGEISILAQQIVSVSAQLKSDARRSIASAMSRAGLVLAIGCLVLVLAVYIDVTLRKNR